MRIWCRAWCYWCRKESINRILPLCRSSNSCRESWLALRTLNTNKY